MESVSDFDRDVSIYGRSFQSNKGGLKGLKMAGKSFLNEAGINGKPGEMGDTRSDMSSVYFGAQGLNMDSTVNSKASG